MKIWANYKWFFQHHKCPSTSSWLRSECCAWALPCTPCSGDACSYTLSSSWPSLSSATRRPQRERTFGHEVWFQHFQQVIGSFPWVIDIELLCSSWSSVLCWTSLPNLLVDSEPHPHSLLLADSLHCPWQHLYRISQKWGPPLYWCLDDWSRFRYPFIFLVLRVSNKRGEGDTCCQEHRKHFRKSTEALWESP